MTTAELNSPHAHDVLEALVDLDTRVTISLSFDGPGELIDGVTGRVVDDVLLEASAKGLIAGDRGEGDGSIVFWSRLALTVEGLRWLGQWPPPGRESEPGGWDDGYWGKRARPLLARLRDVPLPHGFYLKPVGRESEEWADWTAALLLREADLISGRLASDGIDTVRISAEGHRALDPRPRDPLEQASAQLRSGARVDAIVTAVELALGQRLKALADGHDVATTHADGHPIKLSMLNAALRKAGVYHETDRAQIEAWLKLRNDLAHADGQQISDARVGSVIDAIAVFLDEHPIG